MSHMPTQPKGLVRGKGESRLVLKTPMSPRLGICHRREKGPITLSEVETKEV